MSGKPVVLRERARRDIDEAVEHYLAEAGEAVALDFIDALEDARRQIGEQPATGSPRYAHELDIPGLRFRTVGKFPHLRIWSSTSTGRRKPISGASCTGRGTISPGCGSPARNDPSHDHEAG